MPNRSALAYQYKLYVLYSTLQNWLKTVLWKKGFIKLLHGNKSAKHTHILATWYSGMLEGQYSLHKMFPESAELRAVDWPVCTVNKVIGNGKMQKGGRRTVLFAVESGNDGVFGIILTHQLHHIHATLHCAAVNRQQALRKEKRLFMTPVRKSWCRCSNYLAVWTQNPILYI